MTMYNGILFTFKNVTFIVILNYCLPFDKHILPDRYTCTRMCSNSVFITFSVKIEIFTIRLQNTELLLHNRNNATHIVFKVLFTSL